MIEVGIWRMLVTNACLVSSSSYVAAGEERESRVEGGGGTEWHGLSVRLQCRLLGMKLVEAVMPCDAMQSVFVFFAPFPATALGPLPHPYLFLADTYLSV